MKRPDPSSVFQELKKSKKYKYLCDDTLYRIAARAAKKYDGKKAVKAAKNKLHQVYGAFLEKMSLNRIEKLLAQLPPAAGEENLEELALQVMRFHSSTAERIPDLEEFYRDIFAVTGKPRRILDLACGLNAFSVLWMELEPGTEYYGIDIDRRAVSMINAFFGRLRRPFRAECADILTALPEEAVKYEADLVFILKTFPTLEQQEKGAAGRLLESLGGKRIVLSFPVKSLTDKKKGMGKYYDSFVLELIEDLSLSYSKLEYESETVYIVS